MANLNLSASDLNKIQDAIEYKITDKGMPARQVGAVRDIISVERPYAEKLDEVGRSCIPFRVFAGGLRFFTGIATFAVATPAYLFLKYSKLSEEKALLAKHVSGRALDEIKRGALECGACCYDGNFYDSGYKQKVVQFASGKYAHYHPNFPHCVVYSNGFMGEEEIPDAVALSRQISDLPIYNPPPPSIEGTPDNTPIGSPRGRPRIFSREASPIEGTPDAAILSDLRTEIPELVLNP